MTDDIRIEIDQALAGAFRKTARKYGLVFHERDGADLVQELRRLAATGESPAETRVVLLGEAGADSILAQAALLPATLSLVVVTPKPGFDRRYLRGDIVATIGLKERDAVKAGVLGRAQASASARAASGASFDGGRVAALGTATAGLHRCEDRVALCEAVVAAARALTTADAGSLYLVERGGDKAKLFFRVAQNDSVDAAFEAFRMPLNDQSIAGYVATSSAVLSIEDVYELPEDVSYTFNRSFDQQSNYRSKSMLVLPLGGEADAPAAVLQLINKKADGSATVTPDSAEEVVTAFSEQDLAVAKVVAEHAAVALSKLGETG